MSRFLSVAGEQVAELAASYAESGRLSRGRALFRKGAVSDLSISEGSLIASVRGSEGDEYETTVGTVLAPPGVIRQVVQAYDPDNLRSIDELIADGVEICPRDRDLAFGCDCADWDELCKHVVAVLLAFADRVDLDEAELLSWRGIDLSAASGWESSPQDLTQGPEPSAARSAAVQPTTRAQPGRPRSSAAQSTSTPSSSTPSASTASGDQTNKQTGDETDDRSATRSELEALLGDTIVRVPQPDGDNDAPLIDPALAAFFGADLVVEPVEVPGIASPEPLFNEVQLGPLAELGPALATAMEIIVIELGDVGSE